MNIEGLNNRQLVDLVRSASSPTRQLVDEYYRRCIPIYLDFIGIYWHTGFYLDDPSEVSSNDQTRMIRRVADSIQLGQGEQVLDVGCGVGSTACYLALHYQCQVRGLTPVAEQGRIAEQFIEKSSLSDSVQIDKGHAGALPYPDDSVDCVLFFESPCHFPDREQFFREAFRVLKPGGRLAGEDWLASKKPRNTEPTDPLLELISRDWVMPALSDGKTYCHMMQTAGMVNTQYIDMRTEMTLHKGFAVDQQQQLDLLEEITLCQDPLLKMTLEGLLTLGKAVASGSFTIGRFSAHKPV